VARCLTAARQSRQKISFPDPRPPRYAKRCGQAIHFARLLPAHQGFNDDGEAPSDFFG